MADNIYPVTVPKWGIEMQEGTIVTWHIGEGQSVTKGMELVDIETDKIINTMEAPADGVMKKLIADEGDVLSVGALLGVIAGESTSDTEIEAFVSGFKPADASFAMDEEDSPAKPEDSAAPAEGAAPAEPATRAETGGKVRVSPAAARRARELGVDISQVTGTGRGGRISSEDVEKHAEQSSAPANGPGYSSEPLSSLRKTIARRLVEAKQQIPHFYLNTEVKMTNAIRRREEINQQGGVRISLNDIVVRSCVLALQQHPQLNIHLVDEEVRTFAAINMSVAVDTSEGLMTPVVHGAESLDIAQLNQKIKDLGQRAREGSLTPADMRDGTFTVSNLGMFGVTEFQAIINPPQGAILSVGTIAERVSVEADASTDSFMKLGLACDHRVIDGALGARFLATLRSILEEATGI